MADSYIPGRQKIRPVRTITSARRALVQPLVL